MRKAWSVTPGMRAEVLNRWWLGENCRTIAAAVGISRNRVSVIVCKARDRGDRRAIDHTDAKGNIIGRHRHRPRKERGRGYEVDERSYRAVAAALE